MHDTRCRWSACNYTAVLTVMPRNVSPLVLGHRICNLRLSLFSSRSCWLSCFALHYSWSLDGRICNLRLSLCSSRACRDLDALYFGLFVHLGREKDDLLNHFLLAVKGREPCDWRHEIHVLLSISRPLKAPGGDVRLLLPNTSTECRGCGPNANPPCRFQASCHLLPSCSCQWHALSISLGIRIFLMPTLAEAAYSKSPRARTRLFDTTAHHSAASLGNLGCSQRIVCSLCRACVVQIKRRSSSEGASLTVNRPSSRLVQGMPLSISCFWHLSMISTAV